MNLIKPKKLKIGDTIGFLATSGDVENEDKIYSAVNYFEKLGYKTILSDNIFSHDRYLAGDDEERLCSLHSFFKNPDIDVIICVRGGFGAIRLIDKIDYSIIRNNPKIFCGYSDVTALSAMFLKKAGLITYSAPMICSDFGIENISKYTSDAFFDALTSNKIALKGEILKGKTSYNNLKNAEGIMWGGNLSTLVSLCGQDFIPDEKFIFFIEDLNEPVYKIDKMMTQLLNINKFAKNIQAIILGDFLDIDNKSWLNELFNEIGNRLNIPMVEGFKITHAKDKLTIPYGANAKLMDNQITISKYLN